MPSLTLEGGSRLAYREAGRGEPLVLVHGSPAEGRAWSRVAERLTDRYRVLMPDLPGYGGSDPLPGDRQGQTSAMAAAVAALIDTSDQPVRLCGHSYGGNVALHAALATEDRLQSLVLFEPVFFRALHLAGDDQTFAAAARYFTGYTGRVEAGEQAAISLMVDYWFGPGAFAALPEPVKEFLTKSAPRNRVDVLAAFADPLPGDRLTSFAKPVRVVYGGASSTAAPAIARALVKLLPSARLETIPRAGHGMLDSHPAAVAEFILAH